MAPVAAVVVAAALTLGSSCSPPPEPVDDTQAIAESREVLRDPMLELAQSVIALADGMDEARHKVPRGKAMQQAVSQLRNRQDAVRQAVDAAATAAAEVPVQAAADIVATATGVADAAVAAAGPELAFLQRASAVDVRLLAAAEAWDQPGSQSEIRARLTRVAADAGRLRQRARALQPQPPACTAMKRNRVEWAGTVRKRTLALQAEANSAGGATFDRLRRSYRALPFAAEPRTADRIGRQCWLEESGVARSESAMRTAVEELQSALTN